MVKISQNLAPRSPTSPTSPWLAPAVSTLSATAAAERRATAKIFFITWLYNRSHSSQFSPQGRRPGAVLGAPFTMRKEGLNRRRRKLETRPRARGSTGGFGGLEC